MNVFATEQAKESYLHRLRAHLTANALVEGSSTIETPKGAPAALIAFAFARRLNCTLAFYEAIPLKADLSHVLDRWFLWLLEVELGKYKASAPVAALYRRRLAGDEPTREEWLAARNNAYAAYAAYVAADDAAYATAASADDAAAAYAAAADDAAAYAAAAADDDAARQQCWQRCREALLCLVREAPRDTIAHAPRSADR